MVPPKETLSPVILLGGCANATSAARSLGRLGIPVFVISRENNPTLKSKYVANSIIIPKHSNKKDFLSHVLLNEKIFLPGSVIFPCGDEEIMFVAENKKILKENYILDIQLPAHQIHLLDKKKTLELAQKANCPCPKYWEIETPKDLEDIIKNIQFPVLIKPIHTYVFQHYFNKKLLYLQDKEQLLKSAKEVFALEIPFMLCEFIPGPDTLLSSYYVYLDEENYRLFEYTKRVIRRSPPNFGGGSYHITEWLPKTAEMGYRFFSKMGFKGLGNIEFKTDPRDGKLKVIECNARFTAAQELISQSGLDMPLIIYQYLTKGDKPANVDFNEFLTLWLPLDDFDSYRALRREDKITFIEWTRSICRKHVFSYFDWDDLGPFWAAALHSLRWRSKGLAKKIISLHLH